MRVTLDEILAATRARVAEARGAGNIAELERRAQQHAPRGFRRALEQRANSGAAVIAELKQASPSRGTLRTGLDVKLLAREFENAGAAALSVLTEPQFFQGSLQKLAEASRATKLPCLRKDFIVDEFQLLKARAHGADAVLLIVAALTQPELERLAHAAQAMDLDALVEIHDERELERALAAGAELVGVNSRDLRTFHVDHGTLLRLGSKLPRNLIKVAESGIGSGAQMRELADAGYQAFLIGESLMRAEQPGKALKKMLEDFRVFNSINRGAAETRS